MYNVKFMEWTCSCGHKTANVKIGITSNFAVQATWKCQRCGKIPVAVVTLQNMAENVPPPPHERTFYDSVFLKKAHILEELWPLEWTATASALNVKSAHPTQSLKETAVVQKSAYDVNGRPIIRMPRQQLRITEVTCSNCNLRTRVTTNCLHCGRPLNELDRKTLSNGLQRVWPLRTHSSSRSA